MRMLTSSASCGWIDEDLDPYGTGALDRDLFAFVVQQFVQAETRRTGEANNSVER
jgi:hypothetical protein